MTRCNKPAVAYSITNGFRVCLDHKETEKCFNPAARFRKLTSGGRCDKPVYTEREIIDHYRMRSRGR